MPTLQDLRNQRATIVNNARTEYDLAEKKAKAENRDVSAAEEQALERAMDSADELTKQIEEGEKAEQSRSKLVNRLGDYEKGLKTLNRGALNRFAGSAVAGGALGGLDPVNAEKDHNLAVRGWFMNQYGDEVPEECIEAGRRVGINTLGKYLDVSLDPEFDAVRRRVQNAMSSNDPGSGGTLRFRDVMGPLEEAMLNFGPMLQVADVMRTDHSNPLPWPTADDTGNTGAQVGESQAAGDAVDPSTGVVIWGAYKFTSRVIKVPYELIRDSSVNLPSKVGEWCGTRLGRIQNTKFTVGTGANTPYGVVTKSRLGKTAAANNAIAADELIDLQHSVPTAYRQGAQYMFRDDILKLIRKLKSNDNQYLWQPGLQAGIPGTILNSQYQINDDMAAIAASAKVMLYGNYRYYKVRQVNRVRMYRLEERYRENDQDGFVAFIEADGNILDAGQGPIRHLVMAP